MIIRGFIIDGSTQVHSELVDRERSLVDPGSVTRWTVALWCASCGEMQLSCTMVRSNTATQVLRSLEQLRRERMKLPGCDSWTRYGGLLAPALQWKANLGRFLTPMG